MKKLTGVMPPCVTLFDEAGKIDWQANERHMDFLIEKGVDGIAYLGTTGEFGALTMEEKREFLAHMTAYCHGRVNLVAGTSDTCLANVISLSQYCQEIGMDGLLLLPPYFSVYSGEMLHAFFGAVAQSTSLPIILYNFPAQTGFEMTASWVTALAQAYPNIVGVKETVPDINHVRGMMQVKQTLPDFMVFAAYDHQFLEAVRLGVDGFIPAAVNYAPEACVGLWRSQGDETAPAWFEKVMGAMAIYDVASPLFLGVKEAVYQREGLRHCGERLPTCPLSPEKKALVGQILREQKLI